MVNGAVQSHFFAPSPTRERLPALLAVGMVCALGSYVLARRMQLRLATGVAIGFNLAFPAMVLLLRANELGLLWSCVWLVVPILFAGMLARPLTTIVVGALALVVPIVVARLHGDSANEATFSVLFLGLVAVLTFVLSHHRNADERDRRGELLARNAELLALKATLEERVEARTADLQKSRDDLGRAYEELRRNQQSLLVQEKMASLGRLTAGIAHEMNSPIAAVRSSLAEAQGLVEEYERSIADPTVTESDHRAIAAEMFRALDLAQRAAERSAAFVRSMKGQTRDMEARDAAPFDAVTAVRDALQMLAHEVTISGSRVRFVVGAEAIEVVGAPGKLGQVVTNLVTNALDANRLNGGGDVVVTLERLGGAVVLRVVDAGPGIPADLMKRIFDPLFSTKPVGQGTGLGLTIVHDIVCGDFHGEIEVASPPGKGAEVTVLLPLRALRGEVSSRRGAVVEMECGL